MGTRAFFFCLDRTILKEYERIVRRTGPLFCLVGVVLAEKVYVWRLEMGVVLCMNPKVSDERANVRPRGVLEAVSTLERDG